MIARKPETWGWRQNYNRLARVKREFGPETFRSNQNIRPATS